MGSRTGNLVVLLLAIAATAVAPAGVRADSIYLKNGRVIRTDDARVEGDRVVFRQFGAYQSIPLAVVARVEDDDRTEDGGPARNEPATLSPASSAAAPAAAPAGGQPGRRGAAAALQALAGMVSGTSGGVDTAQALQLLQALGTQQAGGSAGGVEGLAPLLGMLGGAGGAAGGLGAMAADLDQVQLVLPALSRLAGALFAPEYSAADTEAAARELIGSLERLGVSPAEIRARARALGVPEDILQRIHDD